MYGAFCYHKIKFYFEKLCFEWEFQMATWKVISIVNHRKKTLLEFILFVLPFEIGTANKNQSEGWCVCEYGMNELINNLE